MEKIDTKNSENVFNSLYNKEEILTKDNNKVLEFYKIPSLFFLQIHPNNFSEVLKEISKIDYESCKDDILEKNCKFCQDLINQNNNFSKCFLCLVIKLKKDKNRYYKCKSLKTCNICSIKKSRKDFEHNFSFRSGTFTLKYSKECKDCQKEDIFNYYSYRNRSDLLRFKKLNIFCSVCRNIKCISKFDLSELDCLNESFITYSVCNTCILLNNIPEDCFKETKKLKIFSLNIKDEINREITITNNEFYNSEINCLSCENKSSKIYTKEEGEIILNFCIKCCEKIIKIKLKNNIKKCENFHLYDKRITPLCSFCNKENISIKIEELKESFENNNYEESLNISKEIKYLNQLLIDYPYNF